MRVTKAWRKQLPLRLSWAMSIHKAQGMTISKLRVDVGSVFEDGAFPPVSKVAVAIIVFVADLSQKAQATARSIAGLNRNPALGSRVFVPPFE